jgi:3'-phosphoadenosine 5'-phosphosulfate sulfotransferase (PAPS reductase)/FAD synthetase
LAHPLTFLGCWHRTRQDHSSYYPLRHRRWRRAFPRTSATTVEEHWHRGEQCSSYREPHPLLCR